MSETDNRQAGEWHWHGQYDSAYACDCTDNSGQPSALPEGDEVDLLNHFEQTIANQAERIRVLIGKLHRYGDHDSACPSVAYVSQEVLDAQGDLEAQQDYLLKLMNGCNCGFAAALNGEGVSQ